MISSSPSLPASAPYPGKLQALVYDQTPSTGLALVYDQTPSTSLRPSSKHWFSTGLRPNSRHWFSTGLRPNSKHWFSFGLRPNSKHWFTTSFHLEQGAGKRCSECGSWHPSSNHSHNWLRHRSRKTVSQRTVFRWCINGIKFATDNSSFLLFSFSFFQKSGVSFITAPVAYASTVSRFGLEVRR